MLSGSASGILAGNRMKTVVTHIGPDLDALTSVWLTKSFIPGWEEAVVAFVPAGTTLKGMPPDADPEIRHVDTGFGKYDHHQTNADTCAARLVYEEIKQLHGDDPALLRLVQVVNDVDHFREVFYPNPTADFWDFSLVTQIDGWRLIYHDDPLKIVALAMDCLDAVYKSFQNKVWAEKELTEKGISFTCEWGKALAIETTNDEVVHLGQKMGYVMVIRKDPKKGYLRIKALPQDHVDLAPYYEMLKAAEPQATWFLHASHHMVLNGSSKNPDMRPSMRPLAEIIDVFKK